MHAERKVEYRGSRHGKVFSDAEMKCRSEYRGHLASIKNTKENEDAAAECDRMGDGWSCWIGLRRPFKKWNDGTSVGYVGWAPGQPDNSGGQEDCVEIQANKRKWNDIICTAKRAFVCQKETTTRFGDGNSGLYDPKRGKVDKLGYKIKPKNDFGKNGWGGCIMCNKWKHKQEDPRLFRKWRRERRRERRRRRYWRRRRRWQRHLLQRKRKREIDYSQGLRGHERRQTRRDEGYHLLNRLLAWKSKMDQKMKYTKFKNDKEKDDFYNTYYYGHGGPINTATKYGEGNAAPPAVAATGAGADANAATGATGATGANARRRMLNNDNVEMISKCYHQICLNYNVADKYLSIDIQYMDNDNNKQIFMRDSVDVVNYFKVFELTYNNVNNDMDYIECSKQLLHLALYRICMKQSNNKDVVLYFDRIDNKHSEYDISFSFNNDKDWDEIYFIQLMDGNMKWTKRCKHYHPSFGTICMEQFSSFHTRGSIRLPSNNIQI